MVCLNSLIIGSLSEGVFERSTATGNETFSLFTRLSATTFIILSVFTLIETIYLKIRAPPLPKNEKRPVPVAVRRSKRLCLSSLIKPRRRQQRERHQAKAEQTNSCVHVRYKSLYISLPSSANQEREMTKFCLV